MFLKFKRLFLLSTLACGLTVLPVVASDLSSAQKVVIQNATQLNQELNCASACIYKGDKIKAVASFKKASEGWHILQVVLLATDWYPELMCKECGEISQKFALGLGGEVAENLQLVLQLKKSITRLFDGVKKGMNKKCLVVKVSQPKTFKKLFKEELLKRSSSECLFKKDLKDMSRQLRQGWQDCWDQMSLVKISAYQKEITKWGEDLSYVPRGGLADEYSYLNEAQEEAQMHLDTIKAIFEKYTKPNLFSEDGLMPTLWSEFCKKGKYKDLSEYDQKTLADEEVQLQELLEIRDQSLFFKDFDEPLVNLAQFVEDKKPLVFNVKELKRQVDEVFNSKKKQWAIWFWGTLFVWRENMVVSNVLLKPTLFVGDYFNPASKYLTLNQALRLFNTIFNSCAVGKEILTILTENIATRPDLVRDFIHICIDFFDKNQQLLGKEGSLVAMVKVFANKNVLFPLLISLKDLLQKSKNLGSQAQVLIDKNVLTENKEELVKKIDTIPNYFIWVPGMALQYLHDSKTVAWGAWLTSFNLPYELIQKITPEAGTMLKNIVDYGLTPEQALKLIRVAINYNPLVKALFEILEQKMRQKPDTIKKYFTGIVTLIEWLASGAVSGIDEAVQVFKDKIEKCESLLEPCIWPTYVGGLSQLKRRNLVGSIATVFKKQSAERRAVWKDPALFMWDNTLRNWRFEIRDKIFKKSFSKEYNDIVKKVGMSASKLAFTATKNVAGDIFPEVRDRHFIKYFSEQLVQEKKEIQKQGKKKIQELLDAHTNQEKNRISVHVDGLKLVRKDKTDLACSMRWYKYLWLPSVLTYWKKSSELEKLEQRWVQNVSSELQLRLKEVQEKRDALHTSPFERLKNWSVMTGNTVLNWFKWQVSWDWYCPEQKNNPQEKEVEQTVRSVLSMPWYYYLWLPNVFARVKDSHLATEESKLCNRLKGLNEVELKLKSQVKQKLQDEKDSLKTKLTALKSWKKNWRTYAESIGA